MKSHRLALATAGLTLLTGSVVPLQASARPVQDAGVKAACEISISKLTTSGRTVRMDLRASRPLIASSSGSQRFFSTRAGATWYRVWGPGLKSYAYGLFLLGGNLYRHRVDYAGNWEVTALRATKLGTGWGGFRTIATSNYAKSGPHAYLYGLNRNGSLYRYAQSGTGYKVHGSFSGFKSFKAMTVISENATYDTLLMTTTGGALYTVRIPVAARTKPVVKLVRKAGWSSFESLVVGGCGARGGALVVGVDHDKDAGYLYAMGKANGSRTAFSSYGVIGGKFDGVGHVLLTDHSDRLVSE